MKKIQGSFFIETSSMNGQNIDQVNFDNKKNSYSKKLHRRCISIMKEMRILGGW